MFGDYHAPVLIGVVRQNKYSRPVSGVILDLPAVCWKLKDLVTWPHSNTYSYKRPNFPVTTIIIIIFIERRLHPLGMFPHFLKRTADVIAPRLSVVFRRLVRLGSFLDCWRQVNVTPIPKGPPSPSVANHRPISIIV